MSETDSALQNAVAKCHASEQKEPRVYVIQNISDFGNVPLDRLDDCLAEFCVAMKVARHAKNILESVTNAVANGLVTWPMPTFIWTDDGKRDVVITVHEPETPR